MPVVAGIRARQARIIAHHPEYRRPCRHRDDWTLSPYSGIHSAECDPVVQWGIFGLKIGRNSTNYREPAFQIVGISAGSHIAADDVASNKVSHPCDWPDKTACIVVKIVVKTKWGQPTNKKIRTCQDKAPPSCWRKTVLLLGLLQNRPNDKNEIDFPERGCLSHFFVVSWGCEKTDTTITVYRKGRHISTAGPSNKRKYFNRWTWTGVCSQRPAWGTGLRETVSGVLTLVSGFAGVGSDEFTARELYRCQA